ncbi:hypothetical protein [Bacillus sp. CDB3]|uniref:hypothetical protein n=1 Tax=Bacillus sp. CDB3 TaxID=360310 RepID=UPI0009D8C568|nr:hypothetical protein [Bacillus sp. CDB3]OQR56238.1 hypothetical protein CDB3_14060 [Bacillus sp. CDB3]
MIVNYHGEHLTIGHDEDVLKIVDGLTFEPTPLNDQEKPIGVNELRWLYEQARHKKTRDTAALYAISRVNYIYQNDKRKSNK